MNIVRNLLQIKNIFDKVFYF